MLVHPDNYAMVLEREGAVVGALIASRGMSWWFHGDVVEDQFFYVLPGHRGHGLVLLRDMLTWARAWGSVRQIVMHVNNPRYSRACRLYEKLGFRLCGGVFIKEI